MRRLSTRSRGDTLFLGWETPRSWSIGRCNTTPRLCCEISCDSLFLFPPLCCGQWGRGLSRRLALAGASGSSVARQEAAAPGTALRGCFGNAAGPPRPPSAGTWGFPLSQRWELPLLLAVSVRWVLLLRLSRQVRQGGEWEWSVPFQCKPQTSSFFTWNPREPDCRSIY